MAISSCDTLSSNIIGSSRCPELKFARMSASDKHVSCPRRFSCQKLCEGSAKRKEKASHLSSRRNDNLRASDCKSPSELIIIEKFAVGHGYYDTRKAFSIFETFCDDSIQDCRHNRILATDIWISTSNAA
jgi:hypothetical protein